MSTPIVHRHPCPVCRKRDALVLVRVGGARNLQTATLLACGCDPSRVRVPGDWRKVEPHAGLIVASQRVAAGKPVHLHGSECPANTLEELVAAWGDLTQPRSLRRNGTSATAQGANGLSSTVGGAEIETAREGARQTDSLQVDPAVFSPDDRNERERYEAAQGYIVRGYPVVLLHGADGDECTCPRGADCRAHGKHPIGKAWQGRAIRSKEVLARRWSARSGRPTNIGILLEESERLLLVDVDTKQGKGGDETIRKWEAALGLSLDPYLLQNTPSDGWHYVLRIPASFPIERLPNRSSVAPGVDVFFRERQFVVSPSATSAGRYRRRDGEPTVVLPSIDELLEAPAALLEHLASLGADSRRPEYDPADLEALKAPSLQLVRDAVSSIPNDERFDAREKWVGMAYRIRTACGTENDPEAKEIFTTFSNHWTSGASDPDQIESVWYSLNEDRASGGWPTLLGIAMQHGFEASADVVTAARNAEAQMVFKTELAAVPAPRLEAQPASLQSVASAGNGPIARLLEGTGLLALGAAEWDQIPQILKAARAALPSLPAADRALVRAAAEGQLQARLKSRSATQDMLRRYLPNEAGHDPFIYDEAGNASLRANDLRRIDLNEQYLVPGLIPAGRVGAVIADYSLGKTWLLIDLGLSLAFGRPWFGRATQERPVVYVAAEGMRGIPKRMAGWLVTYGYLPPWLSLADMHEVLHDRFILSEHPVQLDHPAVEAGLINTMRQTGAGLLILDTLGKSLGSEQSENDNDTANAVTGMLSRIAEVADCTCIFAHHTGYQDKKRGRGASAWTQGLDFGFVIEGRASDFKDGNAVRLIPTKARDGEEWPPDLPFRLKPVPDLVFVAPDGDTVAQSSAVIEEGAALALAELTAASLEAYTTCVESSENTNALYLALRTILNVQEMNAATTDLPKVSRKQLQEQYNAWLQDRALEAGVEPPKLTDTYAKALLAQLSQESKRLIRRTGKGRGTGYVVTDVGTHVAVGSFDQFDRWWRESAQASESEPDPTTGEPGLDTPSTHARREVRHD